jgi:hypothetical protein
MIPARALLLPSAPYTYATSKCPSLGLPPSTAPVTCLFCSSDKSSAAKARFRKGQGLVLAGNFCEAHKMLVMALADLPDHPQIIAAIASIEARGLCSAASAASANSEAEGLPRKDVVVKHCKNQLRVTYTPSLGGAAAWGCISSAFCLDPSRMKLVLRGSKLHPDDIVCQQDCHTTHCAHN